MPAGLPIIVLVVGAVAVVAAVVVIVALRWERKRSEALRVAAEAVGFAFDALGDLEMMKTLGDLPLYGHGRSRRVKNVASGRAGDREVKLFDYQYTTGGGKESHTWRQTVALFPGGGRGLPDFLLAPEHVFHKIGQIFGYQDIDFESNPGFSAHYLLRGPDETAIRAAFGIGTLAFLEQQPGWNVEVRSGNVGIYRAAKRCKPEDLAAFMDEALAVLRALVARR